MRTTLKDKKNGMIDIDAYLCIDTGKGFDDSRTITHTITDCSGKTIFDLGDFNQIYRIRYYPAQDFVVLKIHDIVIKRHDDSIYSVDLHKSNASNDRNEILSFGTKKPVIEVCLFRQKIKQVIFFIEYLLIGQASFNHIYESMNSDFDDAIYDESLKRKTAEKNTNRSKEDLRLKITQIEKRLNSREGTATRFGLFNKNYVKKKLEWLRPLYYRIFIDKRKSYEKWLSFPGVLISTLMVFFNNNFKQVKNSGLFDTPYYLSQNPELETQGIHPILHYIKYGYKTQKNPHPLFWSGYYLEKNPEIRDTQMNPLVHFLMIGAKEGKNPCPLFNVNYYLDNSPEIRETGVNPLIHYLNQGYQEGRNPHPSFDTAYYLRNNPDVAKSNMDPLSHYIRSGAKEKRNPGPFFDTSYYAYQNKIQLDSGPNPLAHYITVGENNGSFPNRQFAQLRTMPKISIIVPVFNVDESYLHQCIRSVLNQLYYNWELCLIDDGSNIEQTKSAIKKYEGTDERIKIRVFPKNKGISEATNEGARLASGEFLGFLDHDDLLTKESLFEIVKTINNSDPDIIYTDEDIINEKGKPVSSLFKPDFSPDLLISHNYITHFIVIRKTLFHSVGGCSKIFDGAQDYDLILKSSERTAKIYHIPKILYRWRQSVNSTSSNPKIKDYAHDSGKLALEAALKRRKINAEVLDNNSLFHYRIKRKINNNPMVSIIVPFKDQCKYLKKCIDVVMNNSTYGNFEIIGIDNGSEENETAEIMDRLRKEYDRIQFHRYKAPFNYSELNNFGVSLAKGTHIVLMNNDIEILNSDWIDALLEHSQRSEVGAVGAKLLYPNSTIQHAGIILGIRGFAGHSHRHHIGDDPGYYNRLMSTQNVSAVTGALMMVKTQLYQEMGGLDELKFSVALNDVDFCMRLRRHGYLNVFTPFCRAVHHESVSRGYEETPEKKRRFYMEIRNFKKKWKAELYEGDPYYNPNLTLNNEDFSIKKNRLPSIV